MTAWAHVKGRERHAGRPPPATQPGDQPGVMLNGLNSCFAAAAFTFLCGIQVTTIILTH